MARALRILMLVAGTGVALLLIGFVVFVGWVTREAQPIQGAADGIVVLTGGDNRVLEGVRLLRQDLARRLLITGVNPRTKREDVRRLAHSGDRLIDARIDLGYDAQDTTGNADETRTWAAHWRFNRIIVVTSSYHMPRSLIELGRALPGVELIPYPVVPRSLRNEPWWRHATTARMLISEYLKLLPSAARFAADRLLRPLDLEQTAQTSHKRAPAS